MKKFILQILQKRNPSFSFDKDLSSRMILQFILIQGMSFLRGMKVLFALKKSKGLLLGRQVHFFCLSRITWGRFLRLGDNVYISAMGRDGVHLGNNVSIGAFSRIIISTSFNHMGKGIKIGNNVGIGEYAYLGGAGGLEIGDDCITGQYLSCHPENHNYEDLTSPIRLQGVNRKGIRIGKNCWIGSKVTILDGVEIGNGCIIAAGSVVNRSFPENSVIGGVPAKIIKIRDGHENNNHFSNLLCRKSV